jgi:uncharacterized caspase-like protein
MSGHGLIDSDYEYRFCPIEADQSRLAETTLTYGEIESLLDDCAARRRIVLLDTCHAGEPDRDDPLLTESKIEGNILEPSIRTGPNVRRSAREITDLLERHFVDLRIGAGAAVLSSSTAAQQSGEHPEVKNGFFTAAILEGIQQHKADQNSDGTIRVTELLGYCKEEVPRLSARYGGEQDPVARHVNLAEDFAVVTYR